MIFANLVDGLLPVSCQFCAADSGTLVCPDCRRDLPWNYPACPGCALPAAQELLCAACRRRPRAFDLAFAAFRYQAPGAQALLGLKYAARFRDARWLAEAMAGLLSVRAEPMPRLLIPVPLHRSRLFRRGFNQSLELARHLGRRLSIPVDGDAAQRRRPTADQIGLSAAQRRRNLRGAFEVRPDVEGQHVALLDDVMTTGATLEELARACRAAGASRIEAWAIARQPLTRS